MDGDKMNDRIVVTIKEPQKISTAIITEQSQISTSTQMLRGARGADGVIPELPLVYDAVTQKLSIKTFFFNQTANLATWVIPHGLNKEYPHVVVKNVNGGMLWGTFEAIDINTLMIKFNRPFIGTAYLS
jgi:hypothetical protein